jgi:hypothetical protein
MSWKLCHRRVDLVGGIASHRRLGKWRTHLSRRLAFSTRAFNFIGQVL